MKSTLFATTAALGLLALSQSALAAPPDMGMVQANIGYGWTDDNFNGHLFDDPFDFGARTQWLFPLSAPIHLQGDLFVEQMDNVFPSYVWGKSDSTLFGGTAHVIRPMEHGRIGVAGSIFNVDVFASKLAKGVNYGLVALEGQYFSEHWTFFAQGGWFGDMTGCDGLEGCVHNGVFLRGNARHFIDPNTAVSFDGQLFWGDDEFFGTTSGGSARLEGEHKFADSRFSGFVGVSYEEQTVDVLGGSAQEETVTIDLGIRMYIDQLTLFDFSQVGPSMNTPTFHNALSTEGTLQAEATLLSLP